MGKDYLLNHIKEQLVDHKESIDKDALWSNLQPALATTAATSVATPAWLQFILNGGFVVLFFTTALVISAFDSDKGTIIEDTTLSTMPDQAGASADILKEVVSAPLTTISTDETAINKLDETKASLTEIKTEPTLVNKNENNSKNNEKTLTTARVSDISSTANINMTEHIQINNGASALTTTDNALLDDEKINDLNTPTLVSSSTEVAAAFVNEVNTNSVSNRSIENILPLSTKNFLSPIETLTKKQFQFGTTDCPTFGNKGPNPWSIFAYTGPNITSKSLSSASAENEAYLNQREETETALESLRSGLGVKYSFRNGIYVKAGIEHLRINERLNTSTVRDTSYILSDQIIQVIVHAVGDTTFVRGNLPVTERVTQNWEVYSKYTALSFPISIGYEVLNNRWSYFGEAGVVINTRFNFSGYITDAAGIPAKDPDIFKSRVGLGLHLTAGIGYNITPRVKLTASPSYFRNFDTVNNDTNLIDQEYSTLGLLLGAEYKF